MLQCTPAAAATLRTVRERNEIPPNFGVRLFATPSPEGGVGLGVDFTGQPAAGDQVTEQHGTTLVVDQAIADQLADMTLDVVPDPTQDGDSAPQLLLRPTELS